MAFLENCVERAMGLAATCGWLAFGGGAEAAVGVAIGGAGLATVVLDAVRRHGPESEAALKSIRKRISKDLHAHAAAERWDNRADIETADAAMERALAGCFIDRQALATSARSEEGFPAAATQLILAKLAEREADIFGSSGPQAARDYARLVISTALEAAIENEAYFKSLHPHLLMETLRGIGAVEEKIEAVHSDVTTILEILSRKYPSASCALEIDKIKVELVVNDRGESIIFHDKPFPYELERVEFDPKTCHMYFVIPGDFRKNFGIPVHDKLKKNFEKNNGKVLLVLMDEASGEPVEEKFYPLRNV